MPSRSPSHRDRRSDGGSFKISLRSEQEQEREQELEQEQERELELELEQEQERELEREQEQELEQERERELELEQERELERLTVTQREFRSKHAPEGPPFIGVNIREVDAYCLTQGIVPDSIRQMCADGLRVFWNMTEAEEKTKELTK